MMLHLSNSCNVITTFEVGPQRMSDHVTYFSLRFADPVVQVTFYDVPTFQIKSHPSVIVRITPIVGSDDVQAHQMA